MPLNTKSDAQFLSDVVTTWAGLIQYSPDLQSGDPLLAMFQALVLCGLMFTQSQAVTVNQLTRAATSTGADLDSWMFDFSLPRKVAVSASGTVQFSLRIVSTQNILIPAGKVIQVAGGTVQYQTIADTLQAAWSPSQNAYVLPAGALSINATVQALTPGIASNVQAGALNQIASPITGVSFVTNVAPIQNGADPEADQPFRDRFKLFINSVNGKATPTGILSAALNTPAVVAASLIENFDQFGNPRPGYGVIVIDDGSGAPPSALIASVTKAVALVRGITIQLLVIGPTLSLIPIALNVKINPAATSPTTVLLNVENAVLNYVNGLEIGQTLYLENLSYTARAADPNVLAVQAGATKINGAGADFTATAITVIRTNNVLTTIGTW